MSSQRQKRRQIQMEERPPINVTCGGCKKVFTVTYKALECPQCGYGKDVVIKQEGDE